MRDMGNGKLLIRRASKTGSIGGSLEITWEMYASVLHRQVSDRAACSPSGPMMSSVRKTRND
jgi:hypothetical protein